METCAYLYNYTHRPYGGWITRTGLVMTREGNTNSTPYSQLSSNPLNPSSMHRVFTYPMLALLLFYKAVISPVLYFFGVRCRHYPSCSSYSKEAIERHGPWPGGWMTLARLLRCHPFARLGGTSGVDKVPQSITKAPLWAPWRYGLWRGTLDE